MTNPDPTPEQPFNTNAYAPPTAPMQPAPPPVVPYEATLGQRIAGALLIANAIIVGLELAIIPADPTSKNPFDSPGRSVLPALIDVGIGIALLSKSKSVLPWAIFRAALGLVVFVALRLVQGDMFLAVMQMAVSGSLLLLLIGDASKPRIAVGSALFGIYGLLSLVGIGATVTGKNPLASVIQSASGQLESEPAGVVTGEESHYQLTTPSDKWRLRTRESAKKDNPLADRWLTRPDVDAHVIVIAEKVAGGMVMPDALTDAVIDNAKKASTQFAIIDRKPLRTRPDDGRMLHTQSTVNGLAIESLVGVVGYYEHGFQIVAFAPRTSFASVEAELRSIVESFKPPTDEKPGAPDDCEPNPVTRVDGAAQKYVLTPPGEGWFLRTAQAAKQDNELADRWIVRPDKGAHILVIAEEAPGAVIDPDKYADAIADNIKTNLRGEVLSRSASTSQPKTGRILHAKATVEGAQFEYLYGLFAEGPRAFQVIAFSHAESFGKLEADFQKAIEAFKMPGS
ncbi:MAG: hypothetical protein IPM54_31680 [Polyangiaceae bacterium]|nr:hypothetical protein [Polyangiaceae bacterium]